MLLFLYLVPEVRDLDSELHEVTDWIPLGLHLGITLPELKIIKANNSNDLKMCRIEMFEEWRKKVTPTWSAVVQALVEIGMRRLASELAQKHGWLYSDVSMNNVVLIQLQCLSPQELLHQSFLVSTFTMSFHLGTPPPKLQLPVNDPLDQLTDKFSEQEEEVNDKN